VERRQAPRSAPCAAHHLEASLPAESDSSAALLHGKTRRSRIAASGIDVRRQGRPRRAVPAPHLAAAAAAAVAASTGGP
jgi:hypothetical protein